MVIQALKGGCMKTLRTYQIIENNKPDFLGLIDPEMKKALDFDLQNIKRLKKEFPHLVTDTKAFYNLSRKIWNENPPEIFSKEDITIEGPHGDLPLRFYRYDDKKKRPCIIFLHGGGYIVGGLDSHDGIVSRLCHFSQANIIAVDYKLAPEYKFPVPIEEAVFTTNYLRESARKFHIDPNQISYAGDSAGVFLSLATYLYLRDSNQDVSYIKSLLLYYGSVGLSDSISKRLYGSDLDGMTYKDLDKYDRYFFGDDKESPALIDRDYTKAMPATFILGCELDPYADDSRVLFEVLKGKNHTVELSMKKGYIHAFLHYSKKLPGADEAIKESAEFFNKYGRV